MSGRGGKGTIDRLFVLLLGEWIEDEDQIIRLKCNYVISAFGSTLNEKPGKEPPIRVLKSERVSSARCYGADRSG